MKKLAVLVGLAAILAWGTGARADFSLTFDGSQDLTGGTYTASLQQDIIVTNQYAATYGVTFLPLPASHYCPLCRQLQ